MTLISFTLLFLACIADIVTTLSAFKRGARELNPLLGRHPSPALLWGAKGLVCGVAAYVLSVHPSAWPAVLVGALVTAWVAVRNHRVLR